MAIFGSFSGTITSIDDFQTGNRQSSGCSKIMSVRNADGSTVNFVVAPSTYFVDHVTVRRGDAVTGFYDASAPTPMIFPPQFRAVVMAAASRNQNVVVDNFNRQLISSDGTLRLNIARSTRIMLENGQTFTGSLANRNLIVVYSASTMSIPAQTTPRQVIVMC